MPPNPPVPTQKRLQFQVVHLFLAITVAALMLGWFWPNKPHDKSQAEIVPVVLRINNSGFGEGSKYIWNEVGIVNVIKNETEFQFGNKTRVAYYSFGKGLPLGVSTVYLLPYNSSDLSLGWKLNEQVGKLGRFTGYSHAEHAPDEQ